MTIRKITRIQVLLPALALIACLGLMLTDAGLGSRSQPTQETTNRYIGAAKCKNCHRSEEAGNQHGFWAESKHAHAYEVLLTPESKAVAKAAGIEKPEEADECLACHVTGHGEPKESFRKGFKMEEGVGCEVCHGPGENHMKARLKAAATQKAADKPAYTQVPEGEIVSTVGQDTCLKCHNDKSPSFKAFCYHKRSAENRHLNPLKPRTKEELAKLLECGCGDACECKNGCEDGKCGVAPKGKDD